MVPPLKIFIFAFFLVYIMFLAYLGTFFFGFFLIIFEGVFLNVYKCYGSIAADLDPRSKILGKISWIQGLDPRSKILGKNFLDPRSGSLDPRSGSKIQDSRKNFLDPRSGSKIQDSRKNFLDPNAKLSHPRLGSAVDPRNFS